MIKVTTNYPLSAYSKNENFVGRYPKKIISTRNISIKSDGDSVSSPINAYPSLWKAFLEGTVANVICTVTNVAVSGQNTASMLSDWDSQVLASNPDIVTISCGLNEIPQFLSDPSGLATTIRSMINKTLGHRNPTGLSPQLLLITDNLACTTTTDGVSSPRPYADQVGTTNFVLSVYNEFGNNTNVFIGNVWAAFNALGVDTPALKAVLPDWVHPNIAGYLLYNNILDPIIKVMVEKIKLCY